MNTKTMRLPPRRVLTSDKRVISAVVADKPAVTNPPPPPIKSILKKTPSAAPTPATVAAVVAEPSDSNHLLAGYLAHEFLNKGTLFGEQWSPSGPFQAQSNEPRKTKPSHHDIEPSDHKRRRYVEVANIIRAEGTHLPGIVNPSQLARFLKL